jgi:hypothetical protein
MITPSRVTTPMPSSLMMDRWTPPMADLSYEVSFKGVAGPTLRAAFGDFEMDAGGGVTSIRCGHDALRTVIARVEEFGLELIDVRLIAEQSADRRLPSD